LWPWFFSFTVWQRKFLLHHLSQSLHFTFSLSIPPRMET
jgi:hypothetical protein